MKTPIRHTLALFTACAALPAAGLLAQSPAPATTATPSVSMPAEAQEGGVMKAVTKLTPEERQKLKAAHKAALEDPTVKAAEAQKATGKGGKKAYRDAVRSAMIKADPSVQPILDKMKEERRAEHPRKKDL